MFEQLDIVTSSEPNLKVNRRCGGYTIGTSYIVRDSIKDIIEKAEQLNKTEMNEQIKFFVAGQFNPLNLTLTPINFSRTLIEVNINEIKNEFETKGFPNRMNYIYDYSKRSYIKKYTKRGRPRRIKNV